MNLNGLRHHLVMSLRLYFRNRMALIYGYLFPTIFLAAFWVLYRHEAVPLVRHMGELLTVSVLGGACFGLPTTLVSERERGVWRRYRLLPVGAGSVVLSTAVARFLIILSTGALQLALALAVGMTRPAHALELGVALSAVAFAFIGLGLVIAMLADNVPAVQALGQCVFLPMLIIGGVAVPLLSLPPWAQHLSAFFPGRYAVEVLQACVNGPGLAAARFDLFALTLIGAAGCVAGAKLFRWESGQRFGATRGKGWLGVALAAWLAVGLLAEGRGRIATGPKPSSAAASISPPSASSVIAPPLPAAAAPITPAKPAAITPPVIVSQPTPSAPAPKSWQALTRADLETLDYNLPPDQGVVTPMALPDDTPDDAAEEVLAEVRRKLPDWAPGQVSDPLQRVRNLLCVAAVTDLVQIPAERYVPLIVLERLDSTVPREDLLRQLAWVSLHPEEGTVVDDLSDLGLGGVGPSPLIRERMQIYATKLIARLTGRTLR